MAKAKLYIFITLLAACAVVILFVQQGTEAQTESNDVTKDSLVTITISFIGDLMCHSPQYNFARVDKDSFDFRPVYREIKYFLSSPDFMIGNLETVTAGKSVGYSGYPHFNTPDEYLTALKDAGFDLLVTANNHSLDKGEKGVLRTIEQIKLNDLNYVGTASDQQDRDSIRYFQIDDLNFTVLSYTFGTNNIPKPKGKDYLVNLIDFELIKEDITAARKGNTEIIIVYYHFGDEYKRFPNQYQKDVVDSTIKFGADIIIGAHPHVLQPVEYFKTQNAKLDTGFVAYSLGNFISNQRWRYSDAGVILNLSITKNLLTDSVYISSVGYLPTWVFKGRTTAGDEYIILPSQNYNDSTYYYLSQNDREQMKQAFEDTQFILTQFTERVLLLDLQPNEQ